MGEEKTSPIREAIRLPLLSVGAESLPLAIFILITFILKSILTYTELTLVNLGPLIKHSTSTLKFLLTT